MNESSIKAFIIPHEAWYKEIIKEPPHITIGLYYESGGTEGEFKIAWEDIGIRLLAFDDSWEVLGKVPELIELMAGISKKKISPTVKQFAEMLKDIGFKDITERIAHWMIDENKLIDELKQSGLIPDNEHENAIVDLINNQPKIGEWIPCSERLPEKGETVIACTLKGTFAGQYHDEGWYRENMFFYDSEILVKDVVAWQPLPEPYTMQ